MLLDLRSTLRYRGKTPGFFAFAMLTLVSGLVLVTVRAERVR